MKTEPNSLDGIFDSLREGIKKSAREENLKIYKGIIELLEEVNYEKTAVNLVLKKLLNI